MDLYKGFIREHDNITDRTLIRVTTGNAFCYPLYYFIPSITEDGKYIVYHRLENNDVQLYATNLQSGEIKQLTNAKDADPTWKIWCSNVDTGVLDHRSVLNTKTNDVVYIENNNVHKVNIDTLQDKILFTIPKNRIASGQNCITPDGKWFVYIHHDLNSYKYITSSNKWSDYAEKRKFVKQGIIEGYNLETGESKTILILDCYFHHVFAYDNTHFVINHPANESGMLYTALDGNWYTHLRTQNHDGKTVSHCTSTTKGIAYEAYKGHNNVHGGIYNPVNHKYTEFKLPEFFGYTHTGVDPTGDLFFYENIIYDADRTIITHDMYYLKEMISNECIFNKIISNRETFGPLCQKSHFHPRMTDDRKYIVFTCGCSETKTNHIYFVDISDLDKTKGFIYP